MMMWLNEPVSNGSIILFILMGELIRAVIQDIKMRAMFKEMVIERIDDEK